MRVFNKDKTIELFDYDLDKGYLKEDCLLLGEKEDDKIYSNVNGIYSIITNTKKTEPIQVYIPFNEEELRKQYEKLVNHLVAEKYALHQEIALIRQKETKKEEYEEYFKYVEKCKEIAFNRILKK